MADGGIIDTLSSIIADIASLEVSQVEGADLAAAVLQAEQILNAANALSAMLLERFDEDGAWAADGALSAVAWTAERTGSARAGLRNRRRQGVALRHLPAVAAQAKGGRVSTEHLRALGECVPRHPDVAVQHEQDWLHHLEAMNAETFRVAARHWLEAAADATTPDLDELETGPNVQVSYLHASRTFDGWLRVDGCFAPQDADLVEAALDAGVDRALRDAHDGDPSLADRPVSALRAAALVDLAAQAMRHEPSDASVPDRYRVAVIVQHGQPTVPAEAVCDATAYRVALGAGSEVLDVGRQTSRWPVAIRRAITIRDRGCVFPGCDRPPSWTDIHHCVAWSEDGKTSVDNGALLCRRHHTFVHHHHWAIVIDCGKPITRRPDGTPFTIRRWELDRRVA